MCVFLSYKILISSAKLVLSRQTFSAGWKSVYVCVCVCVGGGGERGCMHPPAYAPVKCCVLWFGSCLNDLTV